MSGNRMKYFIFCCNFYFAICLIILCKIEFSNEKLQIINHGLIYPKLYAVNHNNINYHRPRREAVNTPYWISLGNWTIKSYIQNNFISDILENFPPKHCQNFQGEIIEIPSSLAILTICMRNMYAILYVKNHFFSIEPSQNGAHTLLEFTVPALKSHQTFRQKRKTMSELFYNLTGDTFELNNDDEMEEDYFTARTWPRDTISSKTNSVPTWESSQRWLEVAVAVDYSLIEFHGERLQQYLLALLNIVGAIYRDPTLGADVSLVVVQIYYYPDKNDGVIREGNARKSLENVNKWNRKHLMSSENEVSHDVAVWLTRLDIGGPSGYAPVSGACDPTRSCALNRDEGLTSAFIIAHELAHILGLTHDGDEAAGNFCSDEAARGSVMAPMVAATFHRFRWSSCSRKEFSKKAKQWKCLNNSPSISNATYLKPTLHETFTMDEQCRMEFGDGYGLCQSANLPTVCSHLWCGHKDTQKLCKTKKGPPLDGTACGKNKWCINGLCETIDPAKFPLERMMITSSREPSELGWSTWSPWGMCSRTCGVGVRLRYRLCNNPTYPFDPAICTGSSQEFKICQQSDCQTVYDLRREQCSRLSNAFELNSTQFPTILQPNEETRADERCRITCRRLDNNQLHWSNEFYVDGTRCDYETTDICIQGKCHKLGCNSVLNSSVTLDACGVCLGDNSTCVIISNKFQRKIRRATTRLVMLPKNSNNIDIVIELPKSLAQNDFKLIFRDGRRKKYEALFDYLIIESTLFKISKRPKNTISINAKGATSATVIISLLTAVPVAVRGSSISVSVKYLTDTSVSGEERVNKYSWYLGGYGVCSVTCGGGVRARTLACRNDVTGRLVNRRKCWGLVEPTRDTEKCNEFSCEFKWIVGTWEGCTKTCGSAGVQQRQIYCVHSTFSGEVINEQEASRIMLPPNLCKHHQQPDNQRDCNRVPCLGSWVFTDWSPCSRSCGRGVQSRMARCVPPAGETTFYHCSGESTPDEIRPCREQGRKGAGCENFCKNDKSRYCVVPNLKKYCQVEEFRRNCCKSCIHMSGK